MSGRIGALLAGNQVHAPIPRRGLYRRDRRVCGGEGGVRLDSLDELRQGDGGPLDILIYKFVML